MPQQNHDEKLDIEAIKQNIKNNTKAFKAAHQDYAQGLRRQTLKLAKQVPLFATLAQRKKAIDRQFENYQRNGG